jgi:thiol:disulfide interchange protein
VGPRGGIFSLVKALSCSTLLLAASLSAAASAAPPEAPREVLPFLENDYAGAVAQAKAKGVPVFVDVWAPW